MGLYIRKGFNFGPFRLNLSRSGLGTSFGVKGARIGFGPRGSYIHMGRGGLYYRKSLGSYSSQQSFNPPLIEQDTALEEIESADASQIVDASSTELLQELNRVHRQFQFFPASCMVIATCISGLFIIGPSWWGYVVLSIVGLPFLLYMRHLDVTKSTAILNYELEPEAEKKFSILRQSFQKITNCEKVWHIEASGGTLDWKREAGASSTVHRKVTSAFLSLPRRVESNLQVPTLPAGRQMLYFFPDRLLVYDKNGVGSVAYSDLEVRTTKTRFIENHSVPKDSQVVDSTWQYVNKKGGPDRRFSNNRQLSIALYGEIHFSSPNGLNELFQCSQGDVANEFAEAISSMRESSDKSGVTKPLKNRTILFKNMIRELETIDMENHQQKQELLPHANKVLTHSKQCLEEIRNLSAGVRNEFESQIKDCSEDVIKRDLGISLSEIREILNTREEDEDFDRFIEINKNVSSHQYSRTDNAEQKEKFRQAMDGLKAYETMFSGGFDVLRNTLNMMNDAFGVHRFDRGGDSGKSMENSSAPPSPLLPEPNQPPQQVRIIKTHSKISWILALILGGLLIFYLVYPSWVLKHRYQVIQTYQNIFRGPTGR